MAPDSSTTGKPASRTRFQTSAGLLTTGTVDAPGQDAPADAIASLQDAHAPARLGQDARGRKTRHSGSHHHHVELMGHAATG